MGGTADARGPAGNAAGDAAGCAAGEGPAERDGDLVRWDPDGWWTFGEAADLAMVPHRTVAQWAEQQRVTVRNAWREGIEIRLVRAGDVAALVPEARARAAESRSGLAERAVYTGPRRSALGGGASLDEGDSEREPVPIARGLGGPQTGSETENEPELTAADRWQRDMRREIDRQHGELRALRSERDGLERSLEAALGSVRPTPGSARTTPGEAGADRRAGRGWATIALASLVALVSGIFVGRSGVASRAEAAGPTAPVEASRAPEPLPASQPMPNTGPSVPFEVQVAPDADTVEVAVDETVEEPHPDTAPAEEAPVEGPTAELATASFQVPGLRISLPVSLRSVSAGREAAIVDAPPCAFADRIASHPALRDAVGPCFGPRTRAGDLVAGTHRVAGTPCCRHHAFVERMTGAATEDEALAGIVEEARQSERDGLVPRLVVLRAERAASRFVDAAVSDWRTSGLDGGAAFTEPRNLEHRWRRVAPADSERLILELTSWIQLGSDEGIVRFRLTLELDAGDEGDVLRSFDWIAD